MTSGMRMTTCCRLLDVVTVSPNSFIVVLKLTASIVAEMLTVWARVVVLVPLLKTKSYCTLPVAVSLTTVYFFTSYMFSTVREITLPVFSTVAMSDLSSRNFLVATGMAATGMFWTSKTGRISTLVVLICALMTL